ncbi:hypothetical protein PoB_004489800 [Plakobranchus ocellatus]|uniref:Uncharacterized protein n=1 Tax=Plakobranchus ocellatus TaxID=259542 RepID=A0AAV4BGV8_9GAST|nr:hypothetical protein PoB_004489800 [Plakobranchus ocellatus]
MADGNKGGSTSKIWILFAFLFFALSIFSSGWLIFEKFIKAKDDPVPNLASENDTLAKYSTYFRTREEQKNVEKMYQMVSTTQKKTIAPMTDSYQQKYCVQFVECLGQAPKNGTLPRKQSRISNTKKEKSLAPLPKLDKRQAADEVAFHACCKS